MNPNLPKPPRGAGLDAPNAEPDAHAERAERLARRSRIRAHLEQKSTAQLEELALHVEIILRARHQAAREQARAAARARGRAMGPLGGPLGG